MVYFSLVQSLIKVMKVIPLLSLVKLCQWYPWPVCSREEKEGERRATLKNLNLKMTPQDSTHSPVPRAHAVFPAQLWRSLGSEGKHIESLITVSLCCSQAAVVQLDLGANHLSSKAPFLPATPCFALIVSDQEEMCSFSCWKCFIFHVRNKCLLAPPERFFLLSSSLSAPGPKAGHLSDGCA